jgi:hypothetical protein
MVSETVCAIGQPFAHRFSRRRKTQMEAKSIAKTIAAGPFALSVSVMNNTAMAQMAGVYVNDANSPGQKSLY